MNIIQVPFTHGQEQTIDPKLLPQGRFRLLENTRWRQDGRLAHRNAYVTLATTLESGTAIAAPVNGFATLENRGMLLADGRIYSRNSNTSKWDSFEPFEKIARFKPVSSQKSEAGLNEEFSAPSCAALGGVVVYVWIDRAAAITNGVITYYRVESATSGNVILQGQVGVASSSIVVPKLVTNSTLNRIYLLIMNTAFQINALRLDVTAPQSGFASNGVVATALSEAGGFDVTEKIGDSNNAYFLCYQATNTTIKLSTVKDGAPTATDTITDAAGTTLIPSVFSGGATEPTFLCWVNTGVGSLVFDSYPSGLDIGNRVGPTTIVTGFVAGLTPASMCRHDSTTCLAVWNRNRTGNYRDEMEYATLQRSGAANSVGTKRHVEQAAHTSRPFAPEVSSGRKYVFAAVGWRVPANGDITTRGVLIELNTANDVDARSMHLVLSNKYFWGDRDDYNLQRMPVAYLGNNRYQFTYPVWVRDQIVGSGVETAVFDWQGADSANAIDLMKSYRSSAVMGRCLYVAGGMIYAYDGLTSVENGFVYPPLISAVTQGTGGSLTLLGVYSYICTYEWSDIAGQRHQSMPSDPVTVTMTGSNNKNTLTILPLQVSAKSMASAATLDTTGVNKPVVHIWRSLNNTQTFQRITPDSGAPNAGWQANTITFIDNFPDSLVAGKEAIYTEVGGVRPHALPPACSWIVAGKDRAMIGGSLDPSLITWSKIFVTGEPLQWADHEAFRAHVPAAAIAGAFLDGQWIVFGADAIWTIFGDGPLDDGTGGEFSSPQIVPGSLGCINLRSVLEVPQGIIFQSRLGLALLPRGGGSAVLFGRAVQDVLTLYPTVTGAAIDQKDRVAVFSCVNTGETDGRLLVYDLTRGEWSTDNFILSPDTGLIARAIGAIDGQLVFARHSTLTATLFQRSTASYTDASTDTFVQTLLEVGDVTPFGPLGFGRMKRLQILGEYRGDAVLEIKASFDSGKTYPYTASWTVSGLAVGDALVRQWDLPAQKGTAYRFQIRVKKSSSATEGLVLNAMSMRVDPKIGGPRLPVGLRA